jgi:hypothetical protein
MEPILHTIVSRHSDPHPKRRALSHPLTTGPEQRGTKPPTFHGRSDGRINVVSDLAREIEDLGDEAAEIEGLVGRIATNSIP